MKLRLNIAVVLLIFVVIFGMISTSNPASIEDDGWELRVHGLVHTSIDISLTEIRSLNNVILAAEMICVSGYSFGESNWTGIRLADILELAGGALPSAVKIAFRATDGFTTDLTAEDATQEDVIVAYDRNGEPIEEKLRLVVPGKWGYKWIAYLNEIELVDYDFRGYYESRGYSDEAEIPD